MSRIVEIDYKEICCKCTDIVASNLHYQDCVETTDTAPQTAQEVNDMMSGWKDRYTRDYRFHARVDSLVSAMMTVLP